MPAELLEKRTSGVVLHPTSLPGRQFQGSFGTDAYRWVDWLQGAGFGIWQILPLCPVADGSPYNSYSAFAGNPDFIDLEQLQQWGWPGKLDSRIDRRQLREGLTAACHWLQQNQAHPLYREYQQFLAQSPWLTDTVRFMVLKQLHPEPWTQWPQPLRQRDNDALASFDSEQEEALAQQKLIQFLFHYQWHQLKAYANERGVRLFGDLPIFVSHDSADVWANQALYKLDPDGTPQVVAGVPPDYFSATGQRWGNPLYLWDGHRASGFKWWRDRLNHSLQLYDAVRIDHFRGFVASWEIPAEEPTAIQGQWVEAAGDELFRALLQERDDLPLIAEDLGIITEDVVALRRKYGLPGMKILQFAFDSDGFNPYLPHNHTADTVIYTGTHDNNTTLGWYRHLNDHVRNRVRDYYCAPTEPMPWPLIQSALASPARWAMVPLQDLLELGEEDRMNTPGTTEGNWGWRFQWSQFPEGLAGRMRYLNQLYNRQPA